jgi:predicted N-acetyltransferase YhbS
VKIESPGFTFETIRSDAVAAVIFVAADALKVIGAIRFSKAAVEVGNYIEEFIS